VYRVSETLLSIRSISYNVDNIGTVTVNAPHSLSYGDIVIIKGFDVRLDGFYKVYSVTTPYKFDIVFFGQSAAQLKSAMTVTGSGTLFKLQSSRVTAAVDIGSITPLQGWLDNDKLWIDNDTTTGGWAVYNKSTPWSGNISYLNPSMKLSTNNAVANAGFGTVTAINSVGTFSVAGVPFNGNGNVIAFVSNISNGNVFTQVANIGARSANSVSQFGASLDTAGNLLYIGNPGNGTTEYGRVHIHRFDGNASFHWTQTLSSPWGSNTGDAYGTSVSASADGTWLFVTAPNKGNVYVYHANTSSYYSYANTITVGSAAYDQFGRTVKTTSDASQTVISAPYQTVNGKTAAGAVYIYDRSVETFVANGTTYLTKYPITSTTLKVTVNGNVVTSGFTANANAVVFSNAPVIGSIINVETNKIQLLEQLTLPTPTSGAAFGLTTYISGNDADVYVASPGYTAPGYYSGIVYRFVNQGASYGTITGANFAPAVTAGNSIRINGIDVVFTGTNAAVVATNINNANIVGVAASVTSTGNLRITSNVTTPYQKLVITPGAGTAIADLGLNVYANVQAILHPLMDDVTSFGSQVISTPDGSMVAIAAVGGGSYSEVTFDHNSTLFDYGSTRFADSVQGSGAVYVYGLVNGSFSSTAQDQYVLVQKLQNTSIVQNDQFGYSLAMTGNTMLVGAPGDSSTLTIDPNSDAYVPLTNSGTYYTYNNFSGNVGWDVISAEQPRVDLDTVGNFYLYNTDTQVIIKHLDYIDPAKGKILGAAQQDLDYITAYDPAVYNAVGGIDTVPNLPNSLDFHWGKEQKSKTWWNIDKVRYLNYEQGNLTYRANNWGRLFPGSTVQVCEWVESRVPPSAYTGPGIPLYPDNSAYCVVTTVNPDTKAYISYYYYWVTGKTSLEPESTHQSTISTIADVIANPQSQGIAYAAAIRDDAISLYGVTDMLSGNTTVLHVDYDTLKNTNLIHSEYLLIGEGNNNSNIPIRIINKLIDSLSGIDAMGNPVTPLNEDGTYVLPLQQRIGLDKNQTVIVNRREALKNLFEYINNTFIQYPIVAESNISLLYAAEPLPDIIDYDLQVSSHAELGYVGTTTLSAGYVTLVTNDETKQGLWTTYTWSGTAWALTRTQSYYTPFYWKKVDWYISSYNSSVLPTHVVDTVPNIATINAVAGDTIKVLNNGNGEFSIYQVNSTGAVDLVGIQNGTIQFNDNIYTTETAGIEIRNVLESYSIFITNFDVSLNDLFFNLINYILSEQPAIDWAFKTSFVTVLHKLRKLSQPASYVPDNQTYYENYINEVKPYRTSIREYLIDYQGDDEYYGDSTDFDVPATYINSVGGYRSPNGKLDSDTASLSTLPQYTQWFNNHGFGIADVTLANVGSGYVLTPTVTVLGGGGTGANIIAHVNFSSNTISRFEVVEPGTGYTSQPAIFINGTGSGAIGYARFKNQYQIDSLPTTTLTTAANVSVYLGNIVSQPNTGAYGTVYSTSTGNTITLVDVDGTFSSNQYIFRDFSNLSTKVNSINSYTQFVNQSYNTVRNITTTLLFDRTSYNSNIVAWQPNITVKAGSYVSYNNLAYEALSNKYEYLTLSDNVTIPAGNIIKQAVTGANATVYSAVTNSNVVVIRADSINGTFSANTTSYIYNVGNINLTTNVNLVSKVSSATSSNSYVYSTAILTLSGNVTANVGNYVTQANATGNARVLSISSNLQLITLGNITGAYQRRGGNILINGNTAGVRPIAISNVFDYTKYQLLQANSFTSATDRITAYYAPTPGMPGRDPSQLMSGISYPGVTVTGVKFDATTSVVTTSNVLYAYSNIGTVFSSNVAKLDFTKLGYTIGQPLTMINTDTNDTYRLTIASFSSTQLVASGIANVITRGANITLKYYDYENPAFLDSSISNTYTNTNFGTSPNDVSVDGGAYIDTYSSHAPEELVPGMLYDSLNMIVSTKIQNNTKVMSYRVVHNMGANASSSDTSIWPKYYGVNYNNSTTLASNLNITDTTIHVTNAAALTAPNAISLLPGIVYINGEKITFYTVDTVNNTLGQIRRAVDATGAPTVHAAGSAVVDANLPEIVPGGNIVHTTTWLNLPVGAANVIVDNFGVSITDNTGNIFTTTGATIGAVTDGLGLENSTTIPAGFIQSLKINT